MLSVSNVCHDVRSYPISICLCDITVMHITIQIKLTSLIHTDGSLCSSRDVHVPGSRVLAMRQQLLVMHMQGNVCLIMYRIKQTGPTYTIIYVCHNYDKLLVDNYGLYFRCQCMSPSPILGIKRL